MPPYSSTLPPNPCLLAILLIIKTRAGPRLVFHYPPKPSANPTSATRSGWYGTASTDSEDNSGSDWSSHDDDDNAGGGGTDTDDIESRDGSRAGSRGSGGHGSRHDTPGGGSKRSNRVRGDARDGVDEELEGPVSSGSNEEGNGNCGGGTAGKKASRRRKAMIKAEREWERVLGFGADGLAKMLTPGRSFNKRRFEIGIENQVFLGSPMFVREDGYWKKKRKVKRKPSRLNDEDIQDIKYAVTGSPWERTGSVDAAVLESHESRTSIDLSLIQGFEPGYGHGLESGAASDVISEAKSASTNSMEHDLTMFNVVFVLNPPALEYQLRVEEMYDNVVKKFAKSLKFEQAECEYVWKQSKAIMMLKDKAKESNTPIASLWPNVISTSSLAKAITHVYDAISASKIAHITLNAGFDTSFQIPQAISTPYVPTATEPQLPGLWLTTATLIDDEDSDTILSPHSALLLLEDEETLLKEIENDAKELSAPLAFFIRNLTPTKSLQKLAMLHSMPLKDVQVLSRHLIYWRRARAIPPLHPRDIYIVSPNANMRALSAAIAAYAARFPTLPSLPKVLHALSGLPRPYGLMIPSKDHRPAYMDILAWLMRGGWVTQLRTFAWVRVPPEVKAAVAVEMTKEAKALEDAERAKNETNGVSADETGATNGFFPLKKLPSPNQSSHPPEDGVSTSNDGSSGFRRSPRPSAYTSPSLGASDTESVSSGRTAIQVGIQQSPPATAPVFHRPSPLQVISPISPFPSPAPQSAPPSTTTTTSPHTAPTSSATKPNEKEEADEHAKPATYSASLIHSPHKASALESRWIEHIGASFDDAELKELWPLLLKYFDGRHALDEIAIREGMKRKRVAPVLAQLMQGGWILGVRHW